ncbi:protease FtsH subunit HflC [Cognatiyoonia koreensis]|uniref:Protein HflC n=1 Tax=Cognatiyoonia koreensis TaxID=364200 RepID=A0A1I0Q6K3_9RHOB|nr:protease modulator HflC [Cognatiyoonia koreensis]SEW22208.1 protease FtsH subunit HflC [Cognatiyoonia koreensis]
MNRSLLLLPLLAILIFVGLSSLFIVDEREKALVLRFGRVVQVQEEPGLAFKAPFIDEVVRYSDLILSRDPDPIRVTPEDQRILIVDAFARYRIENVTKFRQAVGAGGQQNAERSLDLVLDDSIREVLGSVTSNDILSVDRVTLMNRIRDRADARAENLGLTIIDVRLKRTDLPQENQTATFARMIAERDEEAADLRARGREAQQAIQAAADRTVVELESDANRQSLIIRGEADAERNRIFADSFGADPEFFEFYRSMEAYGKSLTPGNSTMVLSPDSEFFNYLKSDQGLAASE